MVQKILISFLISEANWRPYFQHDVLSLNSNIFDKFLHYCLIIYQCINLQTRTLTTAPNVKEYYYATKLFIELIYRSEDMNFDSLYVVESLSFHYRFKKLLSLQKRRCTDLSQIFRKRTRKMKFHGSLYMGKTKKIAATFNSSLYVNSL